MTFGHLKDEGTKCMIYWLRGKKIERGIDGVSSWEWKVKEGRGQADHLLAGGVGFKATSRV